MVKIIDTVAVALLFIHIALAVLVAGCAEFQKVEKKLQVHGVVSYRGTDLDCIFDLEDGPNNTLITSNTCMVKIDGHWCEVTVNSKGEVLTDIAARCGIKINKFREKMNDKI